MVVVDGVLLLLFLMMILSLGGIATSASVRAEKMKMMCVVFECVVVLEVVLCEGEGEFVCEGVCVMMIVLDGVSVYVGMMNGVVK